MNRAELQKAVSDLIQKADLSEPEFAPGKSTIHVCREFVTNRDLAAAAEALLSGWLPEGERTLAFESAFAAYTGTRYATTTVSGSAALLIAFAALQSPNLHRGLRPGDEVATVALTFPTSLNAILLNRLSPLLVDVRADMNIDLDLLEKSIGPRTRAVLILHHLGNPVDMDRVREIADAHGLFVVEDCCDAHGAEFRGKRVGSFGDAGCFSFYAAHAMTMGEGGAVTTSSDALAPLLLSMKTCGLAYPHNPKAGRPAWLPAWERKFAASAIDKRVLYSDIGYKFRILDLQAALGLEQLKRLPEFVAARRRNATWLAKQLEPFADVLQLPIVDARANPSWYGFPLAVRPGAPFARGDIVQFLESKKIETRPLLGGNLLKQPAYAGVQARSTPLPMTDSFHSSGFYVASHPRLTQPMLDYVAGAFEEFLQKQR